MRIFGVILFTPKIRTSCFVLIAFFWIFYVRFWSKRIFGVILFTPKIRTSCFVLIAFFWIFYVRFWSKRRQVTKVTPREVGWWSSLQGTSEQHSGLTTADSMTTCTRLSTHTVLCPWRTQAHKSQSMQPSIKTIALGMFCCAKYTHHTLTSIVKY